MNRQIEEQMPFDLKYYADMIELTSFQKLEQGPIDDT